MYVQYYIYVKKRLELRISEDEISMIDDLVEHMNQREPYVDRSKTLRHLLNLYYFKVFGHE